jgi:hypothetical protein
MNKKILGILICMLFIGVGFLPIITTNVKADIVTGLVAYWNFNEGTNNTLYDQTDYNNDGTIYGADWVSGIEGSALKFNDSSDIVYNIPSSWDDNIGDVFTIASWIKWDGPTGTRYYIFDGRDDRWDMAGFILYIDESNKLNMEWSESGASVTSNSSIPAGVWTHVAIVFDGTMDYFKIYINKMLDKTVSTNATHRNSNHPAAIGNNHWMDGNWRPFHGIIDELRIYNIALTQDNINELYIFVNPLEIVINLGIVNTRVKASILNNGTKPVYNVNWSITVEIGNNYILSGRQTNGLIDELLVNGTKSIKSSRLLGLGPITVTVQAGYASKQVNGFLLGPLVLQVTEL